MPGRAHCVSVTRCQPQEDSEQQRQREHRFWQARLADLVTCMRRREGDPVTVEETEAMDAVELLDLSQVTFTPVWVELGLMPGGETEAMDAVELLDLSQVTFTSLIQCLSLVRVEETEVMDAVELLDCRR